MEIDLLLKIGGSTISDKTLLYNALKSNDQEDIKNALNIDLSTINQVVEEIKNGYTHAKRMIIITGVGSPGHFTVLKHQLHKGNNGSIEQHLGLVKAQIEVNKIRQLLLEVFLENSLPVVQFYASSMYISDKMRIQVSYIDNITHFLNLGMIPVISGDMVPDYSMGYSVLSGDQIIADLAYRLKPRRIVFGSDIDGLYDRDPKIDTKAHFFNDLNLEQINSLINKLSEGDASGQMKGKLIEIKNLLHSGVPEVILLNLKRKGVLTALLNGQKEKYTRFHS
ncbi:isopentenyl phosphate kinase [Candidatus Hodarchaeum mangrovi]